jgi:hypothetical protein
MSNGNITSFFRKDDLKDILRSTQNNLSQQSQPIDIVKSINQPVANTSRLSSTPTATPQQGYVSASVCDYGDSSYYTEDDIRNIVRQTVDEVIDEKMAGIRIMMDCLINEKLDACAQRRQSRTMNNKPPVFVYEQFGMENYGYLLMPYLTNLCKSSNDLQSILQIVIKDLYFNIDYKKNQIVYILPNTFKSITVNKDNAWKNYELIQTLEKIVRRGNDVLQHYIIGTDPTEESEFKSEIGRKKFEALVEFTDKIDNLEDYPDFRERLLKETEHTIITNQHLVHPQIYEPPAEEA